MIAPSGLRCLSAARKVSKGGASGLASGHLDRKVRPARGRTRINAATPRARCNAAVSRGNRPASAGPAGMQCRNARRWAFVPCRSTPSQGQPQDQTFLPPGQHAPQARYPRLCRGYLALMSKQRLPSVPTEHTLCDSLITGCPWMITVSDVVQAVKIHVFAS